jgi:hypothetical protein
MKKILFILVALIGVLSSCEKDDMFDEIITTNEDLFVGRWEFYSMWYDGNNGEQLTYHNTEAFTHLKSNKLHFFDFQVYKSGSKYYVKYKYFDTNSWIDTGVPFIIKASMSSESGTRTSGNSHQCYGETLSGDRCKNQTLNKNGYCYLHQSQSYELKINSIYTKSPDINCQLCDYGLSRLSLNDHNIESSEGLMGYKYIALEYNTPNGLYRIWFGKDGFKLGESEKKSTLVNVRDIEIEQINNIN